MQVLNQDEAIQKITDYAVELHELQLQKKAIDEEIKDMKMSWKEEGVNVGKVTKVLGRIKARAKMSEADIFEEDLIDEKLSQNETIQNNIAQLNA